MPKVPSYQWTDPRGDIQWLLGQTNIIFATSKNPVFLDRIDYIFIVNNKRVVEKVRSVTRLSKVVALERTSTSNNLGKMLAPVSPSLIYSLNRLQCVGYSPSGFLDLDPSRLSSRTREIDTPEKEHTARN